VPGGLPTDLCELNMAASYRRRSMTGQVTFSLFVRRLPPGRGFLIATRDLRRRAGVPDSPEGR
jgi:nicotinate phosphoribosyltransferase